MEAFMVIILTLVSSWSWSKLAKYIQEDIDMKKRLNKKNEYNHER